LELVLKLIAHRGNLNGPNLTLENSPHYLEGAIQSGYEVEIDLWYLEKSNTLFLGHDKPEYEIEIGWLTKFSENIWIHCKNYEALFFLSKFEQFNYFWHQEDDFTITSKNIFWVYPGKQLNSNSVMVLPEKINKLEDVNFRNLNIFGVCSDYIEVIKKLI
jgi:hypothetical protein